MMTYKQAISILIVLILAIVYTKPPKITSNYNFVIKNILEDTPKIEKEVVVEEPSSIVEELSNIEWYTIEVSHYCPCYICCGKTDGITASGAYATEGVTVSLPSSIPLGTRIVIDGHEYICQDRGGAIVGYEDNYIRADIFLYSHEECLRRGRYVTEGYIIW